MHPSVGLLIAAFVLFGYLPAAAAERAEGLQREFKENPWILMIHGHYATLTEGGDERDQRFVVDLAGPNDLLEYEIADSSIPLHVQVDGCAGMNRLTEYLEVLRRMKVIAEFLLPGDDLSC